MRFTQKTLLVICACLLFIGTCNAQNFLKIQGKVIDSETRKPLEGVYVSILKTHRGTITNSDGAYQINIPDSILNPELVFSYIGCDNKLIRPKENPQSVKLIILKRKSFEFDEVIIVPDSFLQSLLRHAYNNIKNNYPVEPTNGQGFYRENMSQQPDNQLIYFNEGFFKLYTGPYNEAPDLQSKLIKSSKHVIANLDSAIDTYRWQSGGIQFKVNDFVLMKEEFIDPANYRQYQYRIKRQTIFNNDSVYEIEFLPKRGARYNGVMYIETKSLAYVAAFYSFNKDFLQEGMGTGNSTRLTRSRKTYYQKIENKWVLREFIYQTSFKDGKSKQEYLKTIEGLNTITSFDGKDGYIPYNERDLERNIFLEQAQVNDSTDWEENSVIVNDSVFNAQYVRSEAIRMLDASNKKKADSRNKKNFLYYLSNLSIGADIMYYAFASNISNMSVSYPNYILLTKAVPASFNTIQFAGSYYYYLNRKWRMGLAHAKSKSAARVYYNSYELGISYKKNLRKRHKPVFIIPELFFGRTVYGYKLGKIDDTQGMKISDKTIKASSFNLYMSTIEYGARGNLRLLYTLTSSYKIGLVAAYYLPVSTQNVLSIDKSNKHDIFFNSGFTVPLSSSGLSTLSENRNASTNFFAKGRYSVGISLFIDFK